jgi:hypothetical protein
MQLSMTNLLAVALAGVALLQSANAHTWIEQMQVIDMNGSYGGEVGYPRGYVARTDPSFTGFSNKWQLPSPDTNSDRTRITDQMLICHPSQRTPTSYSPQYPRLSVAPGAFVAIKYLENGHVTQPYIPAGKPAGSGTVYIFGTYEPNATETLVNVLSWTADGKGGDGKGWLMSSQNYDDGRCHQLNQAPISINRQMSDGNHVPGQPTSQLEQWCESDLLIPADAPVGKTLTTYWVWNWATAMQTEGTMCGKDEYYTTCSDFFVDGRSFAELVAAPKVHTLLQQDPQTNAVSDYLSRTAFNPTPTIITKQDCSFTSATSSPLPASLTEKTSLPAGFSTSIARPPMPKYRVGSSPAGGPSQSAQPTQAVQPTQPESSQATSVAAAAPTSSAKGKADATPTVIVTVTAPSGAPTVTVTVAQSYQFTTITIPASSASPTAVVKRNAQMSAHGRLRHNVQFHA